MFILNTVFNRLRTIVKLRKDKTTTYPVLHLITQIWSFFAGVAGLLTIIGGAARWSSQVYAYLSLVPGSPEVWGVLFIVAAVLAVVSLHVGFIGGLRVGLWTLAGICLLFAVGILFATFTIPTVTLSGSVWMIAAATEYIFLAKLWGDHAQDR